MLPDEHRLAAGWCDSLQVQVWLHRAQALRDADADLAEGQRFHSEILPTKLLPTLIQEYRLLPRVRRMAARYAAANSDEAFQSTRLAQYHLQILAPDLGAGHVAMAREVEVLERFAIVQDRCHREPSCLLAKTKIDVLYVA